ncbi:MAG: SusC/RagA family TonB-linked outer membrane protein, partial [Muribaculaceae bacterium]|nr:SusC/RagA family TonB-linked outer membrane protein [Muribaculaceae bacterium]
MNRTVTRLLALMLLLCPFTLLAQKDVITVTGTVVDSYDEPLIGVSVLVKGTNNGMGTNIDGEFTLKASVGDILQVSYVGFKTKEVAVTGTAPMRIVLEENTQVLEEVVVTAMGIRRKEASLTYATQEVKGEDLMRVQDANFVNSLGGKVSGVTIQQSAGGAGGSSKILLRGNKSVVGNNATLIVVDGIPMTNEVGKAAGGQWTQDAYEMTYAGTSESGDALSLINPDDIESINVLKGANAAALYGSAAANGVLMITTKKGKEGKIGVTVNTNVTFEKPLMTPALQSVYGANVDGGTLTNHAWGKKLSEMTDQDLSFAGARLTNKARNNVDDFFETGTTWNTSVAISGGTEKVTSYFSFSNSNSDGMMPGNNYNRNTFSFRQGYNLFDKRLRLDFAVNYVYAKTQNRPGGGTVMNPLYDLYTTAPNIDMQYYRNNYVIEEGNWQSNSIGFYNSAGNWISGRAELSGPMQNWAYPLTAAKNNPYWLTGMNQSVRRDERIYGYATANFEIIPGLNLQGRINLDRARQDGESKRYATTANPAEYERYGIYNQDKYTSTDIYVDALLSYNKTFKEDWDVSATVGWSGHTVKGNSQNIYGNATYLSQGMEVLPTLINCFE